ncbi:MAG: hypothetical protein ACHQ50_09965 [Fimbriimonadales bacterium]
MSNYDFEVYADQSVGLATPMNERARRWFLEWTGGELVAYGNGYAVELRYVQELCHGMLDAGFTVTKDGMSMLRGADGDLVLEAAPVLS